MSLAEVADVVDGVVHGAADTVVTGPAFVDTRTPEAGGLFVAIAGDRVDGHDFAAGAHEAGAAAVLGSRPTPAPTVVVPDAVQALGRLARHVLDQLPDTTVHAITGSQGKTGTKDYLAHLLAQDGPTVATLGNFNNELGVPLTVLRATGETRHLVVEMGARGIGHVAYLCSIAPPHVAAVLNVGTAHIGEFGTREAIALAKGEIVESLRPDGTAVLNADDPLVAAMASRARGDVLTFGAAADTGVRVCDVTFDDLGRPSFELVHRGRGATVHLAQVGTHQWRNAAAAAAMALAAGMDLDTVADELGEARSASRWRMELAERADGLVVINDAYNANPESMASAVETLATIGSRTGRRSIAVLGEMYELGEDAEAGHARAGRAAAEAGVDVVLSVGRQAEGIAGAFADQGPGQAVVTGSRDDALTWLRHNVSAADVVLVKASRGAALELIADQLLAEGNSTR